MSWIAKSLKTKKIYLIVLIYLTLAFGWWAFLLIENNDVVFEKSVQALTQEVSPNSNITDIQSHPEYQMLQEDHTRKKWMILSEGAVFILTLLFGLYLLNRSHNRELSYKNQQKNFLLSITHELRSPLAGSKLVLETIKKRKLEKVQQDELIESALIENNRLIRLVNDMLLAVRMEEVYEPHFERTNIQKLFNAILTSMKYKFPKIDWKVDCELIEQEVIVDRNGLTSIIVNLMENAAKYSKKTGIVRVIFKEYKDKILIKVADQGIGIPNEEKQKVFERFYRVGSEAVRKSKGTGIGLYLVKKLVESYGGKILVHDNVPKGTIFDVSLPINPLEN